MHTPAWMREIESVWLGLVSPPLHERIAHAHWTPDTPDAYCGRCGGSIGPHESEGPSDGCSACRGKRLPWSRAIRLGAYAGVLREAILETKFSAWRRLGEDLGERLGPSIDGAITASSESKARFVLVPIPTTLRRRARRRIDHTSCIARGVARSTGLPVAQALIRKHVPPQVSIPTSARAANVRGTMRLRDASALRGRIVIVIDDVRTTGATLAAACRALSKAEGPSAIWVATLAVAASR